MTLHIMRGLPGSGKTTIAQRMVDNALQDDVPMVRISRDDLRATLFGPGLVFNGVVPEEDWISRIEQDAIRHHLRAGRSVVVDNLNLRDRYVRQYAAIGAALGVGIQMHDLRHVDVLTCINRDASRGRNGGRLVGRQVIEDLHRRFIQGRDLSVIPAPDVEKFPAIVQNPDLPDAWVFDVDGTLADISWRNPYHTHLIPKDGLHEDVAALLQDLWSIRGVDFSNHPRIIIATGRQDQDRVATEEWLSSNWVDYDEFHCRRPDEGTKVPDTVVKYRMAKELSLKYHIRGWIDDRPKVSRMLRSVGIQVFQVGDPDVEF